MGVGELGTRVWRVRRRGDWIDASLERSAAGWQLRLTRKGRQLGAWEFETRAQAKDAARARLREFERTGWIEHW